MTPASGADHSLDHQTPLDLLSRFTVNLGQAADLQGQLHLTADVLRRVLGDVSVAFFTPQPDCWHQAIWPGQTQREATTGSLAADSSALIRVLGAQEPVFFDPGIMPEPDLVKLGLTESGALYPYAQDGTPCGLLSVTLGTGRVWNEAERAAFRTVGGALGLALKHCAARSHHDTLIRRWKIRRRPWKSSPHLPSAPP